ncbi:MAG: FGGY-family carbohydrate kinase [Elusimicrobiota bacterium]
MSKQFVIGVDVGTLSARAGIFDITGKMYANEKKNIQLWYPATDYVEQSSENIWSAVCYCVKQCIKTSGVNPENVTGISFDATCSLVALDNANRPVTVSPSGKAEQNIIVWMDHRAMGQTAKINAKHHRVLRYVGGKLSPEQQPPKLMWIKDNLPKSWNRTAKFLDLPDFLTYRATGKDVRSLCTTVCKWTYLGHEGRWDSSFFKQVGLYDLLKHNKIGMDIRPMGEFIGNLTLMSAKELGLMTTTKVAVGIIDAHAGGVGTIWLNGGTKVPSPQKLSSILALIGGTSSCHMAVSQKPYFIPGIWGPYYSAMIPGMWLTEGGQSATGSLLDHIIRDNYRYPELANLAKNHGVTVYQYLNSVITKLVKNAGSTAEITKDYHILPYFHGNRSPRADATLRGMVSGFSLDDTIESIAKKYYATIQSIAYGTKHIIDEMNSRGFNIRTINACGGGTKNPVWLQEHADITGCEIVLTKEPEAVLLGTAILAAVGAGKYRSILSAATKMCKPGKKYLPNVKTRKFHANKYEVFQKMYIDFIGSRRIMNPEK